MTFWGNCWWYKLDRKGFLRNVYEWIAYYLKGKRKTANRVFNLDKIEKIKKKPLSFGEVIEYWTVENWWKIFDIELELHLASRWNNRNGE